MRRLRAAAHFHGVRSIHGSWVSLRGVTRCRGRPRTTSTRPTRGHPKLIQDTPDIYGGGIRHCEAGCVVFLVLIEKNSEADVDS
jgi:hypothetical protein